MTVGLPKTLQRQLYKELAMGAGDILVVTSAEGRRLEGRLLGKPNDCFVVDRDNLTELAI